MSKGNEGYPFREVEQKQRRRWEEAGLFRANLEDWEHKLYVLVMFSYPSEKKLHIGHWWNYGPTDTFARFKRMCGYNVFEPMGFDAFGLPAENYAIKHGVHPAITTRESVNYIRQQLKEIGAMYDWEYEVDTSQPQYYKWTQWLFLQLFKHGAAYRKKAPVNWCPSCQTVLANEQVLEDGTCERCHTRVTTRDLEQWFLRITDYADRLLEGLDRIDWPEPTKAMQRNWIGRSEGTEISFPLERPLSSEQAIKCFTTRADTLFGVTYLVLAPEHELVPQITTDEHRWEVEEYALRAREVAEIDRISPEREKSGVFTGAYALHPFTKERLPIWVSDYVLATYGTGAVMAVPAHDERDFQFAQKYNLPIKWVIRPLNSSDDIFKDRAFTDYGVLIDSGEFSGLTSREAQDEITYRLEKVGLGKKAVSYHLRDWLISRQRYWGAPIPMIHCPRCGIVPVSEQDLPVLLPEDIKDFTPRGTSPLGAHKEFMETSCPQCQGPAQRDPDTMDTFVDSSWYFLRYPSARVNDKPFDPEITRRWLPVDVYVGGPEHATGHLIYSRYITKFLYDLGLITFDEPFLKLVHQGIITYHGQRMSKSKGNVVNPDAFIDKYGSDCFRLYLMFMGDYQIGGDWSDEGIVGIRRFQNRIWRLFTEWTPHLQGELPVISPDPRLNRVLHFTIREITEDIGRFQFNTAISRLMEYLNAIIDYIKDSKEVNRGFLKEILKHFVLLLGPMAPHMAEELWEMLGEKGFVIEQKWPTYDPNVIKVQEVTIAVQVNGKLTDTITINITDSQDEIVQKVVSSPKVKRLCNDKSIKKVIYIPGRIINLILETPTPAAESKS